MIQVEDRFGQIITPDPVATAKNTQDRIDKQVSDDSGTFLGDIYA